MPLPDLLPTAAPSLRILADDLTGAADAAAHAFAAGLPARLILGPGAWAGGGAVAFNSASRSLPAADAARRVAFVGETVDQGGGGLWFKKIDSMLRGSVAVETRALAAALGRSVVLLTPALPHLGRVVRRGRLELAGAGGSLQSLEVRAALRVTVWQLGLESVRWPARLAATLSHAAQAGTPASPVLLVADAEDEDDLRALAEAALDHPARPLLAGSGALAGALAQMLVARAGLAPEETPAAPWTGERVLAVIGSRSARAREQVAQAAQAPGVTWLRVDDAGAVALPPAGHSVVLTPEWRDDEPPHSAHAARLAAAAARLLDAEPFTRVVVGGGATAEALLAILRPASLEVVALAAAGMPLLRAAGLPALVLKAGNHGDVNLLRRWLYDNGNAADCV